MTEPLVVVVVPVFDGADLLAGCLESILAQTHRDLIAIVADNASTDDSVAIAEKFVARDRRIRLVRHEVHLPMLDHWNRAFSYAPEQAAYVKQLNVDDRLRPDGLRRLVEVGEANPRGTPPNDLVVAKEDYAFPDCAGEAHSSSHVKMHEPEGIAGVPCSWDILLIRIRVAWARGPEQLRSSCLSDLRARR